MNILPEQFIFLRAKLSNNFCDKQKNTSFLWENLNNSFSIKNANVWKWIDKILDKETIIMFFDLENESYAFKFNSARDVVDILSESFGFEFYLTNEESDYILCFNHHNFIIGVGSVVENLKKFKENNQY